MGDSYGVVLKVDWDGSFVEREVCVLRAAVFDDSDAERLGIVLKGISGVADSVFAIIVSAGATTDGQVGAVSSVSLFALAGEVTLISFFSS